MLMTDCIFCFGKREPLRGFSRRYLGRVAAEAGVKTLWIHVARSKFKGTVLAGRDLMKI